MLYCEYGHLVSNSNLLKCQAKTGLTYVPQPKIYRWLHNRHFTKKGEKQVFVKKSIRKRKSCTVYSGVPFRESGCGLYCKMYGKESTLSIQCKNCPLNFHRECVTSYTIVNEKIEKCPRCDI